LGFVGNGVRGLYRLVMISTRVICQSVRQTKLCGKANDEVFEYPQNLQKKFDTQKQTYY